MRRTDSLLPRSSSPPGENKSVCPSALTSRRLRWPPPCPPPRAVAAAPSLRASLARGQSPRLLRRSSVQSRPPLPIPWLGGVGGGGTAPRGRGRVSPSRVSAAVPCRVSRRRGVAASLRVEKGRVWPSPRARCAAPFGRARQSVCRSGVSRPSGRRGRRPRAASRVKEEGAAAGVCVSSGSPSRGGPLVRLSLVRPPVRVCARVAPALDAARPGAPRRALPRPPSGGPRPPVGTPPPRALPPRRPAPPRALRPSSSGAGR